MPHLSLLLVLMSLLGISAPARVKVFVGEITSENKGDGPLFRQLLTKELGRLEIVEIVKDSRDAELIISGDGKNESSWTPGSVTTEAIPGGAWGEETKVQTVTSSVVLPSGYSHACLLIKVTARAGEVEFTCRRCGSSETSVVKEVLNDIKKQLNWPGAKVNESTELRTRSGGVLRGETQGTVVQTCGVGNKQSREVLTSLTLQTGGPRVRLKEGSTAELFRGGGMIVRLTNGRDVRSIGENGVRAKPDRSLFLLLTSVGKAISTETVLIGLRQWLDESYSIDEPRNALSGVTVEGPFAMAFLADSRNLDQNGCRLEGTMVIDVRGSVRLLPLIGIRTKRGLQSVSISEVAEKSGAPQ